MSVSKRFNERLHQLIATPSVSCSRADLDMGNTPVVDLLASWLEALGFECTIQALEDAPGKANLIAKLGSGDGGLVLAGHSDTVPYDEERWQSDPFKIIERDNKIYGLGTSDMKGFFPVVLAAIEALNLKAEDLKEPLYVVATADEESSMLGARTLVKQSSIKARYAIIGEPTNLSPIRLHKGIAMERIRIQGQSGHSSNPALGTNAMEVMHEVIGEILKFRSDLQKAWQHPGFEIEIPTMNLGCIHGGDNPNRICGHCEIEFDLRLLPGMQIDRLNEDLLKRIKPISDRFGTELELKPIFPSVDPFEQAQDSAIVQLCERLSGNASQSVAFATEAPFMQQLGMQTVVLGPGSIDQAHQPNEYLPIEQIEPAITLIKNAIQQCCITNDTLRQN